ncbi:hypothetical protein [Sphingomonas sp.]|uniref:hypothetical protein n=1 Tax=Sphingomonas sp. TaxID=28214 RepID=UPI00286C08EA|nr:hypothetical protein [Sphingomonas sp.]
MTVAIFLALFPLLLGLASAPAEAPQVSEQRLVLEQEWILRVTVRPHQSLQRIDWVESKGPKCVAVSDIRGALLSGMNHVDLVMADNQRIRATFDDDCPALDFYGNFYLSTPDHRVCVRRDSIRSRIGASCRIEGFRKLKPKLRD